MDSRVRVAIPVPEALIERRYRNYFTALRAFGATPVAVDAGVDAEGFDGLLLPGGGDVNPALYGQANAACRSVNDELDRLQLAALDAFVKARKPVFGICRGLQLINVRFGGTLIQDLPRAGAHSGSGGVDNVHGTRAVPGSLLCNLYGERFPTNSSHHQGVDALGEGLVVTQYADDGVVEALEHATLPIFSVQWHPERMCLEFAREDTVDSGRLLKWFLDRCENR